MEQNTNSGVGCEVEECRYNLHGISCTLDKIHVGCGCGASCTCCDSYSKRD